MKPSYLFLFFAFPLGAQVNIPAYRALADIGLNSSSLNNPAQLTLSGNQIQSFSQIYPGLKELNEYGFLGQGQYGGKNWGLAIIQSGPRLFQSTQLQLSVGQALHNNLGMGIRFKLQSLKAVERPTALLFSSGLSWNYKPRTRWTIAGFIDHHIGQNEAWDFAFETAYSLNPNIQCMGGLRLNALEDPRLALALQFCWWDKFWFRQGLSTSRFSRYHAGLAFRYQYLQFDYSRLWERALGWQESISLSYLW